MWGPGGEWAASRPPRHRTNTIAAAAAAMTAVAAQPKNCRRGAAMNLPITALLPATIIIAAMIGTAATPLITALQNSALMGSSGDQSMTRPMMVAAPIIE